MASLEQQLGRLYPASFSYKNEELQYAERRTQVFGALALIAGSALLPVVGALLGAALPLPAMMGDPPVSDVHWADMPAQPALLK